MEAAQGNLERHLSRGYAVVEGRVAPGEKHPLSRQVPVPDVLLKNLVAVEEVLNVLNEGNHADGLGEELAHPVPDHVVVDERPVLLADDHAAVVSLHQ